MAGIKLTYWPHMICLTVFKSLQVVTHHKVKQFDTEAISGHKNKYLLDGQKRKNWPKQA